MIALHQVLDICVECPMSIQVLVLGTLFVAAVKLALWMARSFKKQRPYAGFPIMVTPGMSPQQSWQQKGHELIDIGARTGSPFQVMTGTGPKIVLPNRFAEEIKAHPDLSFSGAVSNDFFAHMSGFEAFKVGNEEGSGNLVVDVVRGNLTQSLGLITPDLVDEALCSIHDLFGENSEWHEAPVKDQILTLVARLSSRVFLGMELCRNETWLGIAKTYTVSAFMAARELRRWPALLQPLAHRFLKHSCEIRNMYRDAGKLIAPVIDRRRARAAKALAAGKKPPKMADTIGWMHEKAKGAPLDYVAAQLGLSLAAIHTTTESLVQALSDVCAHPELQQSLREEAIQVIREEGWSRTGLYKMRLMDSFLKESQRCHPLGSTAMSRKALKKITLSDGTVVPKNAIIMLTTRFADPDLYENADKFDALRFLRLREASAGQSTYQHVTVSPEHLSFGYGPHACPGRFFASNEIKIALSALLLKYDWSFVEGQTIDDCFFRTEAQLMTRPQVSLRLRRRREEISLEPRTAERF